MPDTALLGRLQRLAWGKEKMDKSGVMEGLHRMMMVADNEADYETLRGAISIILKYTEDKNRSIRLPCAIGDTFYSIIGENVWPQKVMGFRIEEESTYIESEGSMLYNLSQFGTYFFWTHDEAEDEFRHRWRKAANE